MSPFEDYATYIEHDLLKPFLAERKERRLPSQKDIDAVSHMLRETTETGSKNQPLMKPADQMNKKKSSNTLSNPRNQVNANADQNRGKTQDGTLDHGDYKSSVMTIPVSVASLVTASKDPRTNYPDQKEVWGGVTASMVGNAQRIEYLVADLQRLQRNLGAMKTSK